MDFAHQFEGEKERLLEVESRLAQEVTGRERSEEICEQLQQQLKVAQEDCLSLQQNILSLNEKASQLKFKKIYLHLIL